MKPLFLRRGILGGGRLTSHHSKVDHTTKTSACGCAAKAIAAITRWKTESLRVQQSFPWSGKEHLKGSLSHLIWDMFGIEMSDRCMYMYVHISTYLCVHIYGCFQKWGYPQIIHFNRVFHYRPSILGYPNFGNTHMPYIYICII